MDKNYVISLSPMHIALFVRSFGGSGGARVILNIARCLSDKGHRIDLVMGRKEGYYLDEIPVKARIVDLAVHSSLQALGSLTRVHGDGMALAKMVLAPKSHWVLGAIPGLARYLVRERPQVMIAAMDYPNIAAILARDISQVSTKLIVTAHIDLSTKVANNQQKRRIRAFPKVARRFYPKADAIVAVSRGVTKDLTKVINLPPGRITTIYNPVITPEIKDRAMEYACDWFYPGSPPVILAVGKLGPAKDFPTLLRAFARVRGMMKARLIILGEENNVPNFSNRPKTLAFPTISTCSVSLKILSIIWLRPRPSSFLQHGKGLSMVLIEALACGCPVVRALNVLVSCQP